MAGMVLMWTWGAGREVGAQGGRGLVGGCPQSHPLPTHLSVGLREQLNDAGMWRGHHTVPIDLDDPVSHANAPALSNATTEETADLPGQEGAVLLGCALKAARPQHSARGWGLTMPSSTQKPSCSRACGRWMMAVVTGGQWTMLRVTSVCDFTSCVGQGLLA